MKLLVIFILLLPMLLMFVITYLSTPARRGFWIGCTMSVLGIILFIWAGTIHYEQYHVPKVGVIGYKIEHTFWEAQHGIIWPAIYSFVLGLIIMFIGWKYPDWKSLTQSASKSR